MLGKYELNKIYNEDSYEAIKNIPDNSIDLIVIDPPYEIKGNTGYKSDFGDKLRKQNQELNDSNVTQGINNIIFSELVRVMKGINIYIWCNKLQIPSYIDYFVKDNNCKFDILTWHKTNAMPTFNCKYITDTEYCLYFRKSPGSVKPQNVEDGKTYWIEPMNVKDKKLFDHPTIKPLHMIKKLIRNSSKPGDIVADFFIGSGTTAVACKELGREEIENGGGLRNFIGFELDPKWHKVAVDRVNGITANGQTSIFTNFDNEED